MQTQVGDYYTIEGIARKLDFSYFRVYRLIRKQRVPTIRLGRNVLVRLIDVQRAIKQ